MFVDPGIEVDLHSLEDRTSSNSGFPPRQRVDLRSTTANCVIRCKIVSLCASIKPATFRNPARSSSNCARQACRQSSETRRILDVLSTKMSKLATKSELSKPTFQLPGKWPSPKFSHPRMSMIAASHAASSSSCPTAANADSAGREDGFLRLTALSLLKNICIHSPYDSALT